MSKVAQDSKFKVTPLLVLSCVTILILGFVAIALWLRLSFWLELFATYLPQLTLIALAIAMTLAAMVLNRAIATSWENIFKTKLTYKVLTLLIIFLAVHNIIVPTSIATASIAEDYSGPKLNVMTFNKRYGNDDLVQTVNYIRLRDPDILALQESYKNDAKSLAGELGFSHWHVAECDCSAYGSDLVLFSKFPIKEIAMAFEDRIGGVLRAEITLAHESVLVVYVSHIVPAYSNKAFELRPQVLNRLSNLILAEEKPVLVMGDFSASPFSIDVRDFIKDTESTILSTHETPWPKCSWYKYSELFCARIDYIFIPVSANLISQEIGPNVGSDHRPLSATIGLDY